MGSVWRRRAWVEVLAKPCVPQGAPTCLRDSSAGIELEGASMLMHIPTRWARPKLVRPPGFILPCQPVLAAKVPVGEGWLHELKHDGYRVIAFKDGERVRLWSRNGRDWSAEFVAITKALRALPFRRVMLDGEAVSH